MSGILTDEGEAVLLDVLIRQSSADRGIGLQLGLFTNASVGEATTLTQISEPTGGGYARRTLADAGWTRTGSVIRFSAQVFTATGTDMVGLIRGYFLATTGTTPRLLVLEVDPNVPGGFSLRLADSYTITPTLTAA